MTSMVPHSRPLVGPAEAAAASRVVLSGHMAQGGEVAAFEAEVARRLGRRYGVAVSSGTAGLQLALLALGVAGQQVALPSYVCGALYYAVQAAGGRPLLVDIEAESRNIDPTSAADLAARGVKAVILPHMFGQPADPAAFEAAGLDVVEDCAMALGAERGGRPAGGRGRLAVCSFYATKVISSGGEGGMVLTDDAALADRLRGLREYDGLALEGVRFNAKLSDVAAAIGRVQLGRLDEFLARRRRLAADYRRALADLPVRLPGGEGHIYFRYVVYCKDQAAVCCQRLEAAGVAARRPVFGPLHRQLGLDDVGFGRSAAAWEGDVSLPLYPALTADEAARVLEGARRVFAEEG